MRYFSSLCNALAWVSVSALIIAQRDIDGGPLISGFHGLALAALLAFVAACLNFRGAISAAFDPIQEPGK